MGMDVGSSVILSVLRLWFLRFLFVVEDGWRLDGLDKILEFTDEQQGFLRKGGTSADANTYLYIAFIWELEGMFDGDVGDGIAVKNR